MRRIVLIVTLVITVAQTWALPVAGQNYNTGMAAWIRGDHQTALKHFRPLAKNGHSEAQYNLFAMYNNGKGLLKDNVMGYVWLTIAASNGHKIADYLDEKFAAKFLNQGQLKQAQALVKRCIETPEICPEYSD